MSRTRRHFITRACHTVGEPVAGKVDLLSAARGERRITGVAVEMWNHRPRMVAAAPGQRLEMRPFEGDQMADLLAYPFEKAIFAPGAGPIAAGGFFATRAAPPAMGRKCCPGKRR